MPLYWPVEVDARVLRPMAARPAVWVRLGAMVLASVKQAQAAVAHFHRNPRAECTGAFDVGAVPEELMIEQEAHGFVTMLREDTSRRRASRTAEPSLTDRSWRPTARGLLADGAE